MLSGAVWPYVQVQPIASLLSEACTYACLPSNCTLPGCKSLPLRPSKACRYVRELARQLHTSAAACIAVQHAPNWASQTPHIMPKATIEQIQLSRGHQFQRCRRGEAPGIPARVDAVSARVPARAKKGLQFKASVSALLNFRSNLKLH